MSSESIDKYYAKDKEFFITVAKWTGYWGESYEVGMRDLKLNKFKLIASYLKTEKEAIEIGKAAKVLCEGGTNMDTINTLFPGFMK